MAEVCALDTRIGRHVADVAAEVGDRHTVDLVCSHGQAVFHWVRARTRWAPCSSGSRRGSPNALACQRFPTSGS